MVKYNMLIASPKRFSFRDSIEFISSETACDFLSRKTGLSKSRIKDAMNKGAVWIKSKGKMLRLRRATTMLHKGDCLEFHYDEKLLSLNPPDATLIDDQRHYSVWLKPAGLMAQGTMFGDHCSLMRQAELFFQPQRKVYLVHRLDREASGLMLIAHSKEAAARLSDIFQKNLIRKGYRIEVSGDLGLKQKQGLIEIPLDGKKATTEFNVVSYDPEANISIVNVIIKTGRLHQIRRHFDMIGFPVMGDPKYGKGNKNKEGLKLIAVSLHFHCPFQKRDVEFILPGLYLQKHIERA